MDILSLSKQLDKQQFEEALDCVKQVNNVGLILEFFEKVDLILKEECDLMNAIYFAHYDMLFDSETGDYKENLKTKITWSGESRIF